MIVFWMKILKWREPKDVIKSSKNSSPGNDRISYEIFKNMSDKSLSYILELYNKICLMESFRIHGN